MAEQRFVPRLRLGRAAISLAQKGGKAHDSHVLAEIKIALIGFGTMFLFVVLPIVALFWFLGLFIKSAWIRVPLELVILAAIASSLPMPTHGPPKWKKEAYEQIFAIQQIGMAWISYKTDREAYGDREHAIPERFSQLFPGYLQRKEMRLFFNPGERSQYEHSDITEVDTHGRFDYFGGKTGWMLAASKAPIEALKPGKAPKPSDKKYRVILEVNGSVGTWPEEEYQRRVQLGPTDFQPDN